MLGVVSQRLYPRASLPMRLWVHEGDVEAMPDLFRRVPIEVPPNKALAQFEDSQKPTVTHAEGFDEVRQALFGGGRIKAMLDDLEKQLGTSGKYRHRLQQIYHNRAILLVDLGHYQEAQQTYLKLRKIYLKKRQSLAVADADDLPVRALREIL